VVTWRNQDCPSIEGAGFGTDTDGVRGMIDDQGSAPRRAEGAEPVAGAAGDGSKALRRRESLADLVRRRTAVPQSLDLPMPDDGTGLVIPMRATTESPSVRDAGVRASLAAIMRPGTALIGTLVDVSIDELRENPFQPRIWFARQSIEELAQSLADEGQIEPIIVRRVERDGREVLELVAGTRRLEAARHCNAQIRPFPTLRAEVRTLTDEESERLSLIENLQRENLTPLEEGYRYAHLQRRDPSRWSVRAIAEFVHKKKSTVQNRLNLVRDLAVAEAVLAEKIPPTAGFHIMRLPGEMRGAYLERAIREDLTVEQIRADVDRRVGAWRDGNRSTDGAHPGFVPGEGAAPDAAATAGAPSDDAGAADEVRRLLAQKAQVALRIEELEAELRRHVLALREIVARLNAIGGAPGAS
jgi:ParB family chromosome partitioning protein